MSSMETAQQLIIEGVQTPPPPAFDKEDLIKALVEHIEKNGLWSDTPAEESAADIAKHWRDGIDGYELSKNLDPYEGWFIDAEIVEELDGLESVISKAKLDARKVWANAWDIQPPYPIGTHVTTMRGGGVIACVCDYHAAAYLVKEDGCKQEGRHMVINFEDAKPTCPAP